jgi:hypothetical protein
MDSYMVIIFYLFLLLLFGSFMVFHFPNMTSIPASINKLVDEIDDNSLYHHPSWPQRWSHPDLLATIQILGERHHGPNREDVR